jgi:hypothetical protein
MSNVSIKVTGSARVANKFRAMAGKSKNTDPVTKAWAEKTRLKLRAKKYPPKRPGQKYKRTGRLGTSWKKRKAGKNTWAIINDASFKGRTYARYVVGDSKGNRQAWMHSGRWWVARDVIEENIPELRTELVKYIVLDT